MVVEMEDKMMGEEENDRLTAGGRSGGVQPKPR